MLGLGGRCCFAPPATKSFKQGEAAAAPAPDQPPAPNSKDDKQERASVAGKAAPGARDEIQAEQIGAYQPLEATCGQPAAPAGSAPGGGHDCEELEAAVAAALGLVLGPKALAGTAVSTTFAAAPTAESGSLAQSQDSLADEVLDLLDMTLTTQPPTPVTAAAAAAAAPAAAGSSRAQPQDSLAGEVLGLLSPAVQPPTAGAAAAPAAAGTTLVQPQDSLAHEVLALLQADAQAPLPASAGSGESYCQPLEAEVERTLAGLRLPAAGAAAQQEQVHGLAGMALEPLLQEAAPAPEPSPAPAHAAAIGADCTPAGAPGDGFPGAPAQLLRAISSRSSIGSRCHGRRSTQLSSSSLSSEAEASKRYSDPGSAPPALLTIQESASRLSTTSGSSQHACAASPATATIVSSQCADAVAASAGSPAKACPATGCKDAAASTAAAAAAAACHSPAFDGSGGEVAASPTGLAPAAEGSGVACMPDGSLLEDVQALLLFAGGHPPGDAAAGAISSAAPLAAVHAPLCLAAGLPEDAGAAAGQAIVPGSTADLELALAELLRGDAPSAAPAGPAAVVTPVQPAGPAGPAAPSLFELAGPDLVQALPAGARMLAVEGSHSGGPQVLLRGSSWGPRPDSSGSAVSSSSWAGCSTVAPPPARQLPGSPSGGSHGLEASSLPAKLARAAATTQPPAASQGLAAFCSAHGQAAAHRSCAGSDDVSAEADGPLAAMYARQVRQRQDAEARYAAIRQQQEVDDFAGCTFKPSLAASKARSPSRPGSAPPGGGAGSRGEPTGVYERQVGLRMRELQRRERVRQQQEREQLAACTFQPEVDPRSQALFESGVRYGCGSLMAGGGGAASSAAPAASMDAAVRQQLQVLHSAGLRASTAAAVLSRSVSRVGCLGGGGEGAPMGGTGGTSGGAGRETGMVLPLAEQDEECSAGFATAEGSSAGGAAWLVGAGAGASLPQGAPAGIRQQHPSVTQTVSGLTPPAQLAGAAMPAALASASQPPAHRQLSMPSPGGCVRLVASPVRASDRLYGHARDLQQRQRLARSEREHQLQQEALAASPKARPFPRAVHSTGPSLPLSRRSPAPSRPASALQPGAEERLERERQLSGAPAQPPAGMSPGSQRILQRRQEAASAVSFADRLEERPRQRGGFTEGEAGQAEAGEGGAALGSGAAGAGSPRRPLSAGAAICQTVSRGLAGIMNLAGLPGAGAGMDAAAESSSDAGTVVFHSSDGPAMATAVAPQATAASNSRPASAARTTGSQWAAPVPEHCTFRPVITERAAARAARSPEQMHAEWAARQDKLELKRRLAEESAVAACTFAPEITPASGAGSRYGLAKPKLNMRDLGGYMEEVQRRTTARQAAAAAAAQEREAKELAECTFQPKLSPRARLPGPGSAANSISKPAAGSPTSAGPASPRAAGSRPSQGPDVLSQVQALLAGGGESAPESAPGQAKPAAVLLSRQRSAGKAGKQAARAAAEAAEAAAAQACLAVPPAASANVAEKRAAAGPVAAGKASTSGSFDAYLAKVAREVERLQAAD
ncbi:hypothetical protein ABPG75_003547 [Micractinium tetrahymenae]